MPLAYYSRSATADFWAEHWGGHDTLTLVNLARRSPLTAQIEAALPRRGFILEGGCGLGQYVLLLRERGYPIVGVDWSWESLRHCRKASPDAPVSVMELGSLGIKSDSLAAYVSLGVVEHDQAGPDRILREAHRVLAPAGRLILSVPYLNGLRRLARPYLAAAQARRRTAGGQFYQYAFTRHEVRSFLTGHGFRILSLTPYDPARVLRKAFRSAPLGIAGAASVSGNGRASLRGTIRRLLYTRPVLHFLGHMVLAVAEKR